MGFKIKHKKKFNCIRVKNIWWMNRKTPFSCSKEWFEKKKNSMQMIKCWNFMSSKLVPSSTLICFDSEIRNIVFYIKNEKIVMSLMFFKKKIRKINKLNQKNEFKHARVERRRFKVQPIATFYQNGVKKLCKHCAILSFIR